MDHSSIPTCALYRNTGTVIVRLKMEVTTSCCEPEVCPATGCMELVHRPSACEQCTRTRLISHYSDCDSDMVQKCRPYRSSAARSRYVNVCAAVCLLLLVCGLSPRSSAAPHRSRSMERERRDTDGEHVLWGNPCDYKDSQPKPVYRPNQTREVALKLVAQAKNAFESTAKYKDTFVKLHSFSSFDELLRTWQTNTWLPEEWLPKEKVLYQTMPDEYMNQLMPKIDEALPGMYKGLKMVVAGLYVFANEVLSTSIVSDEVLKENINHTMHDVRAVLCYFNEIMNIRNLKIDKLLDSEIPTDFATNMGILLYRDTLNYLEYLAQVFQKLYEMESA